MYNPTEFPEKERALLEDERLKNIDIMIIDEARLVVKPKNWHDFLNQAIADIFALQRRVKRLFLIIVTQDLDDIDKDVRRLVTYWGECYRPLHGPAQLHLSRFYKDTRNPSKIELKKRTLRGIIEQPDGRHKLDFPSEFIFKMPSKAVWKIYDAENFKSKGKIIHKRLNALIAKMKKEAGVEDKDRGEMLIKHFMTPKKYQELLFNFKVTRSGNYRLKPGAAEVLGFSDKKDIKDFELKAKEAFGKMNKEGI